MKIAVLADIHANLEALEAVLADLESLAVDQVVCLGDLVGYGPDPEAVVARIMELDVIALLGNHEAALISKRDRDWLNFQAKDNNIATEALLSEASLDYCRSLPRAAVIEGALFVHGYPPDSVLKYLFMQSEDDLFKMFVEQPETRIFVGHTHELKLVAVCGDEIAWEGLPIGSLKLQAKRRYLINAGSVGQPRDGTSKAKYLIWDSAKDSLKVRAVAYPAAQTAEKILSRGFPPAYGTRLL
jgi:predicted phosphodiesterase